MGPQRKRSAPEDHRQCTSSIPRNVMKAVEIIKGEDTDPRNGELSVTFTESLRQDSGVVVKECPVSLVNRLLMPYLNRKRPSVCRKGRPPRKRSGRSMKGLRLADGPVHPDGFPGLDVCYDVGAYLYSSTARRMKGRPRGRA